MSKAIAFFDFDGTITTKDTLLELTRFHKGSTSFYTGMVRLSPWLIGLRTGIVSAQTAKEKFLEFFFGDTPVGIFQEQCRSFVKEALPAIIRPQANEAITAHLNRGHEVVVVSASPSNWIEEWCRNLDIACIATQLEEKSGFITGKIAGKNCNGQEKVIRIKARYDLSQYQEIYCYGDTKGDKAMLSLATFAFHRPFRG